MTDDQTAALLEASAACAAHNGRFDNPDCRIVLSVSAVTVGDEFFKLLLRFWGRERVVKLGLDPACVRAAIAGVNKGVAEKVQEAAISVGRLRAVRNPGERRRRSALRRRPSLGGMATTAGPRRFRDPAGSAGFHPGRGYDRRTALKPAAGRDRARRAPTGGPAMDPTPAPVDDGTRPDALDRPDGRRRRPGAAPSTPTSRSHPRLGLRPEARRRESPLAGRLSARAGRDRALDRAAAGLAAGDRPGGRVPGPADAAVDCIEPWPPGLADSEAVYMGHAPAEADRARTGRRGLRRVRLQGRRPDLRRRRGDRASRSRRNWTGSTGRPPRSSARLSKAGSGDSPAEPGLGQRPPPIRAGPPAGRRSGPSTRRRAPRRRPIALRRP